MWLGVASTDSLMRTRTGRVGFEAKEALNVYQGRASVMQRIEVGIDERILDTQTKAAEYAQSQCRASLACKRMA